jgi:hypothetical protein
MQKLGIELQNQWVVVDDEDTRRGTCVYMEYEGYVASTLANLQARESLRALQWTFCFPRAASPGPALQ